jgi:hypothetical protein
MPHMLCALQGFVIILILNLEGRRELEFGSKGGRMILG